MTGPDDAEREDAAWRDIVDNYGPRAELEETETAEARQERLSALFETPIRQEPPEPVDADGFVPPVPPPMPVPPRDRLIAGFGTFGVPLLSVIFLLAGRGIPGPLAAVGVAWFIAGSLYLIVHLPRQREDPWDDGAQV